MAEFAPAMKTTQLLPLRTLDGRLRYASYATEEDRQQILVWAQENGAKIEGGQAAAPSPMQRMT